MFNGLHEIDWSATEHAYGPASEIPALLLALRSADAEQRGGALSRFYGAVHHQAMCIAARRRACLSCSSSRVRPPLRIVPRSLNCWSASGGRLSSAARPGGTRRTWWTMAELRLCSVSVGKRSSGSRRTPIRACVGPRFRGWGCSLIMRDKRRRCCGDGWRPRLGWSSGCWPWMRWQCSPFACQEYWTRRWRGSPGWPPIPGRGQRPGSGPWFSGSAVPPEQAGEDVVPSAIGLL